ncbi:MAG: prepilin-type N-terminal cleavage/methylation domain-containing protein, partial [Verrucomicrobiota bacterium]
MKPHQSHVRKALEKGLTLMEISMVIALMLALASLATFSVSNMTEWKEAREAGESLRSVYVAQKSYLADHPSEDITDLTSSKLIPYLPNNLDALPVVQSKENTTLDIKVTVMPPVFTSGGSNYDPSDSSDDSLWDV